MSDYLGTPSLERFRDSVLRNVFWIDDRKLARDILDDIEHFPRPFGIEIGFGQEPARVDLIDPNVTWILTEPDEKDFAEAKGRLRKYWPQNLNGPRMYALMHGTWFQVNQQAQVLVTRNFDYNNANHHFIPDWKDLLPGQRMVFIINEDYENQLPYYQQYLEEAGYPALAIEPQPTRYSHPLKWNRREWVFDYRKSGLPLDKQTLV